MSMGLKDHSPGDPAKKAKELLEGAKGQADASARDEPDETPDAD
jgi:hypothetical protein